MVRKRNPDRHTIDIYQTDFEYLDGIRETDIGKVSFANIIKNICEEYKMITLLSDFIIRKNYERISKEYEKLNSIPSENEKLRELTKECKNLSCNYHPFRLMRKYNCINCEYILNQYNSIEEYNKIMEEKL